MSDYGRFKFGGVSFPIAPTPFVEARVALDPFLSTAIAFFKAMLDTHLGQYFAAMVTATDVANMTSTIVGEAIAYDPSPYLTLSQYKFPLLALYRVEEETTDHTVAWYKSASTYTMLYILPPLTAAQANRITSILKGVRSVIIDRTNQGYDPAYMGGAEVWGDAGIMSIGVTKARYGTIPDLAANIYFPALELTFACEERENESPGLDTLAGVDVEIDVSNGAPNDGVKVAEFTWENV